MKNIISVIWVLVLLTICPLDSSADSPKDHEDTVIDYLTCNHDIGNGIDDNYAKQNEWQASWHGNDFAHTPQPGVSGSKHDDKVINYLTWDGSCWSASWDPDANKFAHAPINNKANSHRDTVLNYLTWDRSKWSAIRTSKGFKHIFAGDAVGGCDQYCVTCTNPKDITHYGHKETVCTGGWIAGPIYRAAIICSSGFSITNGSCH